MISALQPQVRDVGPARSPGPWNVALRVQVAFAVVVTLGWLCVPLLTGLDADYAAGEMADNLAAWLSGAPLYSPVRFPPYRVLNYPPLFFAAARGLAATGIPATFAGRLVSAASAGIGLLCALRWAQGASASRQVRPIFLALVGTSFCTLYFVPQFHIQWLAVALDVVALWLLATRTSLSSVVLAGALAALACFAKQTQAISALIALAWLLAHDRKRGVVFAASGIGVGVLGMALCQALFGSEIWRQLFAYTIGSFSLPQLLRVWWPDLVPWLPVLGLGIGLGVKRADLRRDLRWWYFVGTSLWLLSCARLGSSSQYMLEWSIAALVWVTPWLAEAFEAVLRSSVRPRVLMLAIAVYCVALDVSTTWRLVDAGSDVVETKAALPDLCAILPPGRLLLTEAAPVARACGRDPLMHPFIMSALSRSGLWDQRPLLQSLERGDVPIVLLPFNVFDPRGVRSDRWTPAMLDAIRGHFHEVNRVGRWRVLAPTGRGRQF